MSPAEPRLAASVLVLRPGHAGAEVLLVRRAARSGFFPLAWVFPGGRVEDGDHAAPGGAAGAQAAAAVRETLEEADLWLGDPGDAAAARTALGDAAAWRSLAARLPAGRLHPWAWWVKPPEEPRRFDTRFFLCTVDAGQHARPDAIETTEAVWMRPADALSGPVSLAPPTWVLLDELARLLDVQGLADFGPRPTPPVRPRLRQGGEGVEILLPGHPENQDGPAFPGPSFRLVPDGPRWRFA